MGDKLGAIGQRHPPLGTTHADYFDSAIPCTREMYDEEIIHDYELNTGKVIAETFQHHNYEQVPGVLVNNHGPFCWGTDALNAIHNAVVLETVAEMAYHSIMLNKDVTQSIQSCMKSIFIENTEQMRIMASHDTPVSPAGILIDLDGTVFRGNELIEGAREAIKTLRRMGKKIVFLSNRGNISRAMCRKKLLGAGLKRT